MSEYIHKSHNVSVLLYHLVFPAKYRRAVFDNHVDEVLKDVCLAIEDRYELNFLEIGTDKDHVHFLVQSVPTYEVTKIVRIIKSLTAREIFRRCPQVKKQLWGGEFWSDGYFASTVGKHGDEKMISKYVKNQGKEYTKLHENLQLRRGLSFIEAIQPNPVRIVRRLDLLFGKSAQPFSTLLVEWGFLHALPRYDVGNHCYSLRLKSFQRMFFVLRGVSENALILSG